MTRDPLGGGMDEDLETRVAGQFAPLYLTFASVMVGLVLADLLDQVHARMVLWPLTLESLRTWAQIFANALGALSAWVTYAHLGLPRRRLPTIWDSLDASLVLVTIPLNANAGRHDAAPYFFWGAAYCVLAICAVRINLRQATREPALAHLPHLGRFGGPYTFLYLGVPGYLGVSVLSYLHLAPPLLEIGAAVAGSTGAIVVSILFMREWRAAMLWKG